MPIFQLLQDLMLFQDIEYIYNIIYAAAFHIAAADSHQFYRWPKARYTHAPLLYYFAAY